MITGSLVTEKAMIGSIIAKDTVRDVLFFQFGFNLIYLVEGNEGVFCAKKGVDWAFNVFGTVEGRFTAAGGLCGDSSTVEGSGGLDIWEGGAEIGDVTAKTETNTTKGVSLAIGEGLVINRSLNIIEEFTGFRLFFIFSPLF